MNRPILLGLIFFFYSTHLFRYCIIALIHYCISALIALIHYCISALIHYCISALIALIHYCINSLVHYCIIAFAADDFASVFGKSLALQSEGESFGSSASKTSSARVVLVDVALFVYARERISLKAVSTFSSEDRIVRGTAEADLDRKSGGFGSPASRPQWQADPGPPEPDQADGQLQAHPIRSRQ